MSDTKYFDNTRVSAWKTCNRMYFIRHVMHWQAISNATALTFGSGWHAGQDMIWDQAKNMSKGDLATLAYAAFSMKWEEAGLPLDMDLDTMKKFEPRTPAIAYEMFYEYVNERWDMLQRAKVIAIEKPFAVPIPGMPNVWYVGKLDKVVEYNSMRLVLEHKTTTAYATNGNFRWEFVESWDMNSQVKGYEFGGSLHYGNIDQVWIDAALVHRTVHRAFKFIPVFHSYPIMEEWISGTAGWIADIIQETEEFEKVGELKPGMFKKNEESCYGKYGPCAFVDICRSIHDPSKLKEPPPGYEVSKWEPFSILGLDRLVKEEK